MRNVRCGAQVKRKGMEQVMIVTGVRNADRDGNDEIHCMCTWRDEECKLMVAWYWNDELEAADGRS